MKRFLEGSMAIAEAVKQCKVQVISAYPITPQTHIVEGLAQMVADGELMAEYVRAESEHSAASVVLGASATGARTYTASTSQGILLMNEVLYNIAGLRLPVVLTCVNRAVSSPLNIWNDQQDSFSMRDSGVIQLYAEDNQEAYNMQLQAFKIAEDHRVLLPVMVCIDGFILSHTFEPVEIFDQELIDEFLPPYKPLFQLIASCPIAMGAFADPDYYLETRYLLHQASLEAKEVIKEVAEEFQSHFQWPCGSLVEEYRTEGATTIILSLGSVMGTIKEVVDDLRAKGEKVGALKVRVYRPFPQEDLFQALKGAERVAVLEKAVSIGKGGILSSEVRSIFSGKEKAPKISGFIGGLGGRDIPKESIINILKKCREDEIEGDFVDLKEELIGE